MNLSLILSATDTVNTLYEFQLYDTIRKEVLMENTGFLCDVKHVNNNIHFRQYIYNPLKDSKEQIATYYLLINEDCYTYIKVFHIEDIELKSISEIQKMNSEEQLYYLFIGSLSFDNKLYIDEFINLEDKFLSDSPLPLYSFYRSFLVAEKILIQKSNFIYTNSQQRVKSVVQEICK